MSPVVNMVPFPLGGRRSSLPSDKRAELRKQIELRQVHHPPRRTVGAPIRALDETLVMHDFCSVGETGGTGPTHEVGQSRMASFVRKKSATRMAIEITTTVRVVLFPTPAVPPVVVIPK